jgi:hypothetical protein
MTATEESRLLQLVSEAAGIYWSMNVGKGYTMADYTRAAARVVEYAESLVTEAKCEKSTL